MAEDTHVTPAIFTNGPAPVVETKAAAPVQQSPFSSPPGVDGAAAPPIVPVVDVRSEINSLASQFGYSPEQFANFQDVNSAQEAIRLAVESSASKGWNQASQSQATRFSQPAKTTAAPVAEYTPPDVKSYGLDAEDAAAKLILAQDRKLHEYGQTTKDVQAKFEAWQEQQAEQQEQVLRNEADQIVSAFGSTRYGTSQHRTMTQTIAMENLFNTAFRLAAIDKANGVPYTLASSLAKARLLDENKFVPAGQQPPAQKPVLPQASPQAPSGIPQMRMVDQWSANPEFRAKYGLPPL